MKKKLTMLIFLLPFVVFAQTQYNKDGSISIDFGKKKQQQVDTPKPEKIIYPSDEEEQEEAKTAKQRRAERKASKPDTKDDFNYKRDGLFKGLFHAGLNACQIDGDLEYGYKYLGANVGVGVMVRFHKFVSVSMMIDYSMKGAKARIIPSPNPISAQLYRIQNDYMEVPIALNVHDKKLIMASIGIAPAFMVRYNERNYDGQNVTDNPPFGQPRRFDLSGFVGFGFVIKQNFYLGGKFSYSFLKMRGPYSGSKTNGQYNNVLTFSFMYILDAVKKKK